MEFSGHRKRETKSAMTLLLPDMVTAIHQVTDLLIPD